MITIDGRPYITVKEYATLLGVTPARVNQLKNSLPIRSFTEPSMDLIDVHLLTTMQKAEEVKASLVGSPPPLPDLTLDQLGNFLITLIQNYQQQTATAVAEQQEATRQRDTLLEENQRLESDLKQLQASYTSRLADDTKTLMETIKSLQNKLADSKKRLKAAREKQKRQPIHNQV